MKKNTIHLLFLLLLSPIIAESISESSFSGGYLSLGIQIGKTENKTVYIDIQISPSIVLIGPYKHDSPGYLFSAVQLGKDMSAVIHLRI